MSDYWTFRTWTAEHEELIARASEQRLAREARRARRAARAAARAAAQADRAAGRRRADDSRPCPSAEAEPGAGANDDRECTEQHEQHEQKLPAHA